MAGCQYPAPAVLQPGRRHGSHCTGETTQHYISNLKKTTFEEFTAVRNKFLYTEHVEKFQEDSIWCRNAATNNQCHRDEKYSLQVPETKQDCSKRTETLIVKCFRRRV